MSEYYNSKYFSKFRTQNFFQKVLLPRIDRKEPLFSYLVDKFEDQQNRAKLLDIGCGTGLFLKYAKKYFECGGMDISKEALGRAKVNASECKLMQGSFADLDKMQKELFDVVTCFDVLEHVLEHDIKLEQVQKVLKPQGVLAISVPNADYVGLRLKEEEAFTFRDPSHLHHFGTRDWKWLFRKNGFVPLRTWHGGMIDTPYFARVPNMLQNMILKYPTQMLSLYGWPIPAYLGSVTFMVLVKNPGWETDEYQRQVELSKSE